MEISTKKIVVGNYVCLTNLLIFRYSLFPACISCTVSVGGRWLSCEKTRATVPGSEFVSPVGGERPGLDQGAGTSGGLPQEDVGGWLLSQQVGQCECVWCVEECIVWRGVLCGRVYCVERCIVWRGVLCGEVYCVEGCIVWITLSVWELTKHITIY